MKPVVSLSGLVRVLLVVVAAQPCQAQAVSGEELQRRVAFANEHFAAHSTPTTRRSTPGSRTDRGRAYIVLGPPDQIRDVKPDPNTDSLPWEEWTYRAIPEIGTSVCIAFMDLEMNNSYRMVASPCDAERGDQAGARRRYELIRKRIQQTLGGATRPEKQAR